MSPNTLAVFHTMAVKAVLEKLEHPTNLDQALRASKLTAAQILIHHTKVEHLDKNHRHILTSMRQKTKGV